MGIKNHDFLEFLEEEIRMRYASDSYWGPDNRIVHKLSDPLASLYSETSVSKTDVSVYNPNILFMHPSLKGRAKKFYELYRFNYVPKYLSKIHFLAIAKENLGLEYDENEWAKKGRPAFMVKNIFENFKKLRSQKYDLVVLGYGGAMMNTLWNWSVYARYLSVTYPFKSITVYEPENIAFTNLLRIGKPMVYRDYYNEYVILYSFHLKSDMNYDPEKYKSLPKIATFDEEAILGKRINLQPKYFDKSELKKYDLEKTIFIGAPDMETRAMLAEAGANFFMLGHHDNRVRISKCPVPEGDNLLQETYGTVEIPVLLMNLQLASMKMIEILAQGPEYLQTIVNDTTIWVHDFDQYKELIEQDGNDEVVMTNARDAASNEVAEVEAEVVEEN